MSAGARRALVLALMGIVTGLTLNLLIGRRPGVGRVLVTLSEHHGIHVGDVPVVAIWVIGMVCGVLLLRDRTSSGPA